MTLSDNVHRCAIAMIAGLALLSNRPAGAQARPEFELARTSFSSVRQYIPGEATQTQLVPPANLIVTDVLHEVLDLMLRRSPTFRRQCGRIGSDPRVTVHVALAQFPSAGMRAKTHFRRGDGAITARVEIAPLEDRIELIAHEIEHVLEQLDGVDLRAKSLLPGTGVRSVAGDGTVFETVRATRVGLQVAAEIRQ